MLIPVLPASSFATWGGLVLPTITIAIMQIALISRLLRREMVTNFAAPYLTVARSRGVRDAAHPALCHAQRLCAGGHGAGHGSPPCSMASWSSRSSSRGPASARWWSRLETRDYLLIVATVLITSVLAVLVQLLVDLRYPLLDPRVRLGKAAA